MVKVKSHTGIELNEGADRQAKLGLDAEVMTACPHNDALPFRVGGALSVQAELRRAKIRWYAQRLQWREDHTVSGVTTLSFRRPGLGQQYMGAAMRRLPAGHRRRWWLSLCDCYPTQAYRYRTNQTDDPDCRMPECRQRETYDHITCACRQTADIVTASHNKVWKTLYDVITLNAPKAARMVFDTPMAKSGFKHTQGVTKLQPDGLFLNPNTLQLFILEFARTGDSRPDKLQSSTWRKQSKYETLRTELQTANPELVVQVIPFIIGARSFVVEADWEANWHQLGLPAAALRKAITRTMARNQEVISDILDVRTAVLRRKSKKGDG